MKLGSSLLRPRESNKTNIGSQKFLPTEKARPNFREPKVLYSILFDAYGLVDEIPENCIREV